MADIEIDFERLKKKHNDFGGWEDADVIYDADPINAPLDSSNKPFCSFFTPESKKHLQKLHNKQIDNMWVDGLYDSDTPGSIMYMFDGQGDDPYEVWEDKLQKYNILPLYGPNCFEYTEGMWDALKKAERKIHYKKEFNNFITIAWSYGNDEICATRALYDRDKKYTLWGNKEDPMSRFLIKKILIDEYKDTDLKPFGRGKRWTDLVVIVPEGDPDDKDDPYAFC